MNRAARVLSEFRAEIAGRGVRFALSGVAVSIVYLSTTTLLAAVAGLPFQAALVIAYGVTIVVHFALQRFFVWAHREQFALPLHRQLGRYLLVAGGVYGATAASALLLPPVLGLSAEAVYLIVTPILTAINFMLYRNGVFHARSVAGGEKTGDPNM